ncbi:MAG: hypothetical protein WC089_03335 [Candidatus Paceibacterota bacterium]
MHNHNNKENNWMMWAMMICCMAPILFIVFLGTGAKSLGFSFWIAIGGLAVFIIVHFIMMKKSTNSKEDSSDSNSENKSCH